MAASEREVLNFLKSRLDKPSILASNFLGEDCEALEIGDLERYLLVSVDTSSEKIDFPSEGPPFLAGYFSTSLSLSDISACGGYPIGILASCSISPNYADQIEEVYEGIESAAHDVGTEILGGDTNSAGEFSLSIVSFGWVEKDKFLQRRRANIGDLVGVTGQFLDRFNYNHFEYHKTLRSYPFQNYEEMLKQTAQIRAGRILTLVGGVTSCIDLPDGLVKSLEDNMAEGLGFLIEDDLIPLRYPDRFVNGDLIPRHILASDPAGDIQLLFTVSKGAADNVERLFAQDDLRLSWIGKVTADSGIKIKRHDGTVTAPGTSGFVHKFDDFRLFR